jgi:hypothetical protein
MLCCDTVGWRDLHDFCIEHCICRFTVCCLCKTDAADTWVCVIRHRNI